MARHYWWPGITMQVKNYVSGCDHCQRMKSFPEKPTGKLKPNEATSQPWKDITTDFITGLLLRHTKPITRLSRAYKNQTTEM